MDRRSLLKLFTAGAIIAPVIEGAPRLDALGQLEKPALVTAPGSALTQLDAAEKYVRDNMLMDDKFWCEVLFHIPEAAKGFVSPQGSYVSGPIIYHSWASDPLIDVRSLANPYATPIRGLSRGELTLTIAVDESRARKR